jgi:hypothetical protein
VLSESNLLSSPYGIDVLDAGHLVVSSLNNGRIVSIALAGGAQTLIAETNGIVQPWGVAVHGTNLYVGDPGAQSVQKISAGRATSLWVTTDFPSGLAVEMNGNILAGANGVAGEVVRLDPQGKVLNTYSNALLTMVAGVEVSRIHVGPGNQVRLTIVLTPTNTVVVWWALSQTSWQLQATTNLPTSGSIWTDLSYQTNGATCCRIESPPAGNKFYRLKLP